MDIEFEQKFNGMMGNNGSTSHEEDVEIDEAPIENDGGMNLRHNHSYSSEINEFDNSAIEDEIVTSTDQEEANFQVITPLLSNDGEGVFPMDTFENDESFAEDDEENDENNDEQTTQRRTEENLINPSSIQKPTKKDFILGFCPTMETIPEIDEGETEQFDLLPIYVIGANTIRLINKLNNFLRCRNAFGML